MGAWVAAGCLVSAMLLVGQLGLQHGPSGHRLWRGEGLQ